jgi:broad specificity phosphatase PhoE
MPIVSIVATLNGTMFVFNVYLYFSLCYHLKLIINYLDEINFKFFIGALLMSLLLAANSYLEIDSSALRYVDSAPLFNAIPTIATDAYDYLGQAKKTKEVSRFIFVRHGESTSNAEKSVAGRTLDVDLSEKGVQQANEAGKKLAGTKIKIDAIYSSPSRRAINTAQLILNILPIQTDERLYEKFYGPFEGASEQEYKPVKKLEEIDNSGPQKLFVDKFKFKANPKMETMADVYVRVLDFLQEMHKKHQGQNVLVATHNGVMKALFIVAAARQGFDVDYRSFDLENASIVVVEVGDFGIQVPAANGLKYREGKS